MTHIIIRDVEEDEVNDLLDDIAAQFGLLAEVIEDGEFV